MLGLFSRFKRKLNPEQHKFWQDNGYLVLKGFYEADKVDSVSQLVDELWEKRKSISQSIVIDTDLHVTNKRQHISMARKEHRAKPYKINDLYLEFPIIREVALGSGLGKILCELLKDKPVICNSLNFERGSEQGFHTDSLYMTPRSGLNLAAAWIALEDVSQNAGPLTYYPGSHKIPPFHFSSGKMNAIPNEMSKYDSYMMAEIQKRGLKKEEFTPKKGDILFWHSQLYHGGSAIHDLSLTRKSLIIHYYARKDMKPHEVKPVHDGFYWQRHHQPIPST